MPGFLIEDWMMNERLGLKGNDLLIYALIYSFTRKGGTMFERFCEYYRQNGWELSGGDILDTVEKRKRAAGNWRVQNPSHRRKRHYRYL